MKTSIARCLLAIGLLLVATARPTSANLIINGDFETGTFVGWTTTPAGTGSNFGVNANAECNAAASANSGAKRDTTLRRMYTSPDDRAASTVGYRLTVISDR